jgi:hypothetical protein
VVELRDVSNRFGETEGINPTAGARARSFVLENVGEAAGLYDMSWTEINTAAGGQAARCRPYR